MAISNSVNFTVTRDEIISQAYRQIGVLGEGETATLDQVIETSPVLNMMLKTWQADGLNLFAIQKNYLFLEKGVASYEVSVNTSNHFTNQFYSTTTSAAASSGATSITVTSASNISAGDYIGVASGTDILWTTVNGAPSGSTVNLTDALTSDVASGDIVYSYTSKSNKPLNITDCLLTKYSSGTDLPIEIISRKDYSVLPSKLTSGNVTQIYFDRQVSSSKVLTWPVTSDERDYLTLYVQRTLSDMDSSTDEPEYPKEWFLPIYLNLALLLAPRYGVPNDVYQKISQQAAYWYNTAKGFDSELYTSVFFAYDNRY